MENNKLDKRTKWSYCIGATGRDMAYALVSMFLLTYIQYTMKLTVAQYAVISAIMVVCLLWDAINDPMMGIIIENSSLSIQSSKNAVFSRLFAYLMFKPYVFSLVFALMSQNKGNFFILHRLLYPSALRNYASLPL